MKNDRILEQLSTEHLDEMLQAELKAERPDASTVRQILDILREREKDFPVEPNLEAEIAWVEFQRSRDVRRSRGPWGGLIKAAAIILLVGCFLFSIPQSAEAGSVFDLLAQWSDGFVEFFTSDSIRNEGAYEFVTDHPGLQQLYDTVTEAGAEGPAVPMWVWESMELVEMVTFDSESKTSVIASFEDSGNRMVYKIDIYDAPVARKYYKDEDVWSSYEENGVVHTIMRNNELWAVIWSRDNIQGYLSIDCQEDTLYKILGSIYNMVEDN